MSEGDLIWKLILIGSAVANVVMGYVMWSGRNAKNSTSIEGDVHVRNRDDFVPRTHHEKEVGRLDRRIDACENGHKIGDDFLRDEMKGLGERMERMKEALQVESSRRGGSLHKRLDESDKVLSAVDERSKNTDSMVRLMNQNLHDLMKVLRK